MIAIMEPENKDLIKNYQWIKKLEFKEFDIMKD